MKKQAFKTLVSTNEISYAITVNGYVIDTDSNKFGIYKDTNNGFIIIDLATGLEINNFDYYRLKDIIAHIKQYDNKLNELKLNFKNAYKKHIEYFEQIKNESEVDE